MEFVRFLATKDEINTMANIKGVPSVAADSEDIDIYKDILKPEKVEMEGVNEGNITAKMVTDWYTSVNNYVAGKYASSKEALEDFIKMCKQ